MTPSAETPAHERDSATRGRLSDFLAGPFRHDGRMDRGLTALFCLLNGLVTLNALIHDPYIGYDSSEHILYFKTLAAGRLPTPSDTHEFFSAPLPYVPPALLYATGAFTLRQAAQFAQLLNVLYSLGLTFYLLKTCELVRPQEMLPKLAALGILAMLPVYYKSFAFVRGEPLLAFLAVLAVHEAIAVFRHPPGGIRRSASLGIVLGLAALARQWGILLFPALILFAVVRALRSRQHALAYLKALAVCLAVSGLMSGWFYLHLRLRYGSVTAFNRPPGAEFRLSNQPAEFYFGLSPGELFSDPVRGNFRNQLLPKLYSELWGDHECYFLVFGKDSRDGTFKEGRWLEDSLAGGEVPPGLKTNRYEISRYLGRVNRVSLLPTVFLLGGFLLGLVQLGRLFTRSPADGRTEALSLQALVVLTSLLGYLWFLVMYPTDGKGDTIKATYLLQAFPPLALLAGELITCLAGRWPKLAKALGALLALIWLHNLPACISRYTPWQ